MSGVAQTSSADDVRFLSGDGQFFTCNPDSKRPAKHYSSISLTEILELAVMPPSVEKSKAKWAVFSDYVDDPLAREIKTQKEKGNYYALWADIDEQPDSRVVEISELKASIDRFTKQDNYLVYSTSGATKAIKKWRVIIPLAESCIAETYSRLARLLNDQLEEDGITPDRACESPVQLCFLPNRGDYYEYHIGAKPSGLNWKVLYSDALSEMLEREQTDIREIEVARQAKRSERAQLLEQGICSPIDAFNAVNSIECLLEQYGYIKAGSKWLSPNSSSRIAGLGVIDDGQRYVTSHQSDISSGLPASGDAFDLFTFYEHRGVTKDALHAAGQIANFHGVAIERANQRAYMASQDTFKPTSLQSYSNTKDKYQQTIADSFDFKLFSLNGMSKQMRSKMLDDKYVLGKLAILGQSTVFYAKPNSGKTLLTIWLLIEGIKNGEINGDNVCYVNADDNYKGLVTKLEIAEKYGFHMLAPKFNGFEDSNFLTYLERLIAQDRAQGKVLILDTLKKFTNIMDKKVASDFGRCMREFVSKGGTCIMLAHTNKHRNEEGKVVFSGTSDIVDDADCAYTIDVSENNASEVKTVMFENIKSRGDVAKEAIYSYSSDAANYLELIRSVRSVSDEEAELAKRSKAIDEKLRVNAEGIEAILESIEAGYKLKTELIENAYKSSGISKKKIAKILREHSGKLYSEGHRWREFKGEKNTKKYEVLFPVSFASNSSVKATVMPEASDRNH